jgi:hypothetical protein
MHSFNRPTETVATLLPPCRRNPQRITITVTWQTHQLLANRSDYEGRSLSNLAAHLLERGVTAT